MRSKATFRSRFCVCVAMALAVALIVTTVATYSFLPDYRHALEEQRNNAGTTVVDRDGAILRIFPDSKERYCLWQDIDAFPSVLKSAVISAEDQRFRYHPGFDPIAIARALYANLRAGRTVSGASTLSQQVVRLIRPRPRTYRVKFVELLEAVKLEWQLTKDEILELYLNMSPMGGSIRGAGLAARIYFGKDVSRLNLPEAAVLAALPRSPSRYSPKSRTGSRRQLLAERDRILTRMAHLGYINAPQLERAVRSGVRFENRSFPLEAPHLVDWVVSTSHPGKPLIKTTLDLNIQQAVDRILQSHKNRLRRMGIRQAGAIVVSTSGPELLAMVGSLGYEPRDQGFNNAALARRGAGSTLKPFLYALALEKGFQAFSEIPDTVRSYPTPHGDYLPVNADRRSYGPVTIRLALANSLNMSAVKVARALGIEDFCELLQRLDLVDEKPASADRYGLGIAIGNVEVSLYQLVQAYTALARLGHYRPLMVVQGDRPPATPVLSPETAYTISDILADSSARVLTFGNPSYFDFGFPVSLKTGTSSNHRDAWAIAYTSRHVIGMWAGNFDGRATSGVTGSAACGPMVKEVVDFLYGTVKPACFERPSGVRQVLICGMSGELATENCPHKTSDLVVGRNEPPRCRLPHHNEYHYLGGAYASWIHRRESELGPGRFRLTDPSLVSDGGPWWGYGYSRHAEPPPAGRNCRIEIVSPHDRDHFVLSPYHPNRILFRAVPQPVVEQVVWFVDGVEIARTPPPYEWFWGATRGRHVVHAVTPAKEADRVTIYVE